LKHREGRTLKAHIIRIGKSHGIRIPDALLEQAGLSGEVEISAEGNALVIRPAPANRSSQNVGGVSRKGVPPLPPYAKLKRLAKKSPPPASWFDEEGKPF